MPVNLVQQEYPTQANLETFLTEAILKRPLDSDPDFIRFVLPQRDEPESVLTGLPRGIALNDFLATDNALQWGDILRSTAISNGYASELFLRQPPKPINLDAGIRYNTWKQEERMSTGLLNEWIRHRLSELWTIKEELVDPESALIIREAITARYVELSKAVYLETLGKRPSSASQETPLPVDRLPRIALKLAGTTYDRGITLITDVTTQDGQQIIIANERRITGQQRDPALAQEDIGFIMAAVMEANATGDLTPVLRQTLIEKFIQQRPELQSTASQRVVKATATFGALLRQLSPYSIKLAKPWWESRSMLLLTGKTRTFPQTVYRDALGVLDITGDLTTTDEPAPKPKEKDRKPNTSTPEDFNIAMSKIAVLLEEIDVSLDSGEPTIQQLIEKRLLAEALDRDMNTLDRARRIAAIVIHALESEKIDCLDEGKLKIRGCDIPKIFGGEVEENSPTEKHGIAALFPYKDLYYDLDTVTIYALDLYRSAADIPKGSLTWVVKRIDDAYREMLNNRQNHK